MSRIRAFRTILFMVAAMAAVGPASAHSPYFTQTETIVLPDGREGQIRLLHGDGILRSDPVRAVIVDADGRAQARTPRSYAMVIHCDRRQHCKAYDLNRFAVSTPEPASFRDTGPVADENERWKLEDGYDSWGFATKRMSLADAIVGHAAYLMDNKFDAALPLLLTALAVTFILGVLRPAPSQHALTRLVWYFIGAAAFCLAGLFLLMSMLSLMITGLPLQLWLLLSLLGALVVGVLFYWSYGKRAAQPA